MCLHGNVLFDYKVNVHREAVMAIPFCLRVLFTRNIRLSHGHDLTQQHDVTNNLQVVRLRHIHIPNMGFLSIYMYTRRQEGYLPGFTWICNVTMFSL